MFHLFDFLGSILGQTVTVLRVFIILLSTTGKLSESTLKELQVLIPQPS
jgi:hypothetical protein